MLLGLFKKKNTTENKYNKNGKNYYELTVKEIIQETPDAIKVIFDKPNEISYQAGQYITIILTFNGKESRRSYSLCSSPVTDDFLAIAIKKVDGGNVSNYLVRNLNPGDKLNVLNPGGNFTTEFHSNNERTLLLFAGGSGITPILSIIKTALHTEPKSKIILVYQNRNIQTTIFKDYLEKLHRKFPHRFQVVHILSKPEKTWEGKAGRLSAEMVAEIVKEEKIDLSASDVFFCGPKGMMDTAELVMKKLGVDKNRRYKESFVSSSRPDEDANRSNQSVPEFEESEVTILLEGEEYQIKVKREDFILETGLDAGLDLPFSCQSGLCTTCRGKLLEGKVIMEDPEGLTDDEIAEGYVLICIGHPGSEKIRIEIG